LHFVANGKELVPINEDEINAIQNTIRAKLRLEPVDFLATGQTLLLNRGPLAGVRGFLTETPKRRLVISLTSLQRSVAFEIEAEWAASEAADDAPRIAVNASGRR
jgi:transcription antitermination factor NusG